VSNIILQNSQAYSVELQRISDFKHLLEDSYQICSIARRSLLMNELVFTMPVLKLIKNQMKRTHLVRLSKSIRTIKSLESANMAIKETIDRKEFARAVEMCFECRALMAGYEHFNCIKDLKAKIQAHISCIEQNLELTLALQCIEFDENTYERIVYSYRLLSMNETFVDKLSSHMISSIDKVSTETIIELINDRKLDSTDEQLKKKQFNELCSLISYDDYKKCLVKLCIKLWSIMKNYYRMCIWHNKQTKYKERSIENTKFMKESGKRFKHCLTRIWQEVQNKISICFLSMCFENYKFDEFIHMLTIINKFIEIGHEYIRRSENSAESTMNNNLEARVLIKAAKDQTLSYFKAYHVTHLEELSMFLENEAWQWCPVKENFSIYKLHEYKFLRDANFERNFLEFNSSSTNLKLSSNGKESGTIVTEKKDEEGEDSIISLNKYIISILDLANPFDEAISKPRVNNNNNGEIESIERQQQQQQHREERISNGMEQNHTTDGDDECESNETIKPIEYVAKNGAQTNYKIPMITNTTLNVIRLFGKYIHMLSIFRIISIEVISYLMQLFNFYLYYIYIHFAQEEVNDL
jgi:syndetin